MDGEGRGQGKVVFTPPSPAFSLFLTVLVQISFSPQPSASIEIKDSSHNFCYENTEHSLAKIKPVLRAKLGWLCSFILTTNKLHLFYTIGDMLDEVTAIVDGYNAYFSFSKVKTGYSGM